MNTLQRELHKKTPVIRFQRSFRKNMSAYLLILPCVLLLALMMVYPVFQTIRFSLFDVKLPSFDMQFSGLSNFARIFSKDEIATVFSNTFVWIIGSIILKFILGFWAAIIFNTKVKGGVFLRILCLLPWTMPSIASSNLWRWILQSDTGLLNEFLRSYGMGALARNWLGDPQTAIYAVMVANAWAGFPFVMLMILAAMQGIPKELYEAGEIDGAGPVQLFLNITLPILKPIIIVVLLLQIISNMNSFDMLYVLTGGGPGGASETLGLFIYRLGFTNFDFGGASAISIALLVIAFGFFIFYSLMNNKVKRGEA